MSHSRFAVGVLAAVVMLGTAVCAQQAPQPANNPQPAAPIFLSSFGEPLNTLKTSQDQAKRQEAVGELLNPGENIRAFLSASQISQTFQRPEDLLKEFAATWERARIDKQIGASASGSGSTDLVSRAGAPLLLGLGVQLGALTQTVSGTTATFRGSADSLLRTLAGLPLICETCKGTPFVRGFDFSVSFDMSRDQSKQVAAAGSANSSTTTVPANVLLPSSTRQFSGASVRYQLHNPKDLRSDKFQAVWKGWFDKHKAALAPEAAKLQAANIRFFRGLLTNPDYIKLRQSYAPRLLAADPNEVEAIFSAYLSELLALARRLNPAFDQQRDALLVSYGRYSDVYRKAIDDLKSSWQLTAEYNFNRPVAQPDLHTARLIFAANPFSGKGMFTANAAGEFYGTMQAGAKYGRVRDFQLAAQFDRPLGDIVTHPAVLSLSGYMQYQFDPSVINIGPGNLVPGTNITLPKDAQVLLGTKGTLGILQAKIILKMKDSGVKIPIGVSWSNKTDLLNATDVRGHIGITYDFDSLLTR